MKIIMVLTILSMLLISCSINKQAVKPDPPGANLSDDIVIIYSTSWCYWCKVAKQFMVDNNIEYIEKDLENEKHWKELKEIAKSIGYKGNLNIVPLFIIKDTIISGYQPLEILSLLGRKKGIMKTYSKDKLENGIRGSNFIK